MKIKLAPSKLRIQLIENTSHFVDALINEDHDYVYEELITTQSVDLLATMAWPLVFYKEGNIDFLFNKLDQDPDMNIGDALSLAFQMDAEGCLTGIFQGFIKNFVINR